MGCGNSKQVRRIHNSAFDLIDADGDAKVSKEEFDYVADFIHQYHVNKSARDHNTLANTKPEAYLYELLGKSPGSKLKKSDFRKLAFTVPSNVWQVQIIPLLREKEIERLSKMRK